ncbi:MAG: C40 family peptidase [Elusimicrobia bacterium]|nr:C40 family peptidase [Elusimicrobiota bacterium]MBP9698445.1 C40 family peptidase [Elusimicrobiota bacterium]
MKKQLWLAVLWAPMAVAAFEVQFTPEGPVSSAGGTAGVSGAADPIEGAVSVPVVDLRRLPEPVSPHAVHRRPYPIDSNQETQLLFGERVRVLELKKGWLRVEAVDQFEFSHSNRWQGYPGWVPHDVVTARPSDFHSVAVVISRFARMTQTRKWRSARMDVPMGSRFAVIYTQKDWARVQGPSGEMGWMRLRDLRMDRDAPKTSEDIREAFLAAARQFLGDRYYWGGRSGHRKKGVVPSGVDCSGLVNVSFRAVGVNAPRDAFEQHRLARPVEKGADLFPGDLVFLAKKSAPDQVVHVMIFEKMETLLEASHDADRVRRISFKKRVGTQQTDLRSGDVCGDSVVRFGTFFFQ